MGSLSAFQRGRQPGVWGRACCRCGQQRWLGWDRHGPPGSPREPGQARERLLRACSEAGLNFFCQDRYIARIGRCQSFSWAEGLSRPQEAHSGAAGPLRRHIIPRFLLRASVSWVEKPQPPPPPAHPGPCSLQVHRGRRWGRALPSRPRSSDLPP